MNKKLLALAVAAALAPAAAMADSGNVVIYGQANASYDNISNGAAGADTLNKISSNSSRIGFKGTENLGNGLSAVWQMETAVALDGGTTASTLGSRNTFVGLSSKTMGTALLGRHDTPYKLGTASLDIFADTMGDYNSIIGNVGNDLSATLGITGGVAFDSRLSNVAAYISPTWNNFHFAVATVAAQETSNGATPNAKAYSATGVYSAGPLFASLSWEKASDTGAAARTDGLPTLTAATGTSASAVKLGLGYTVDALKLGFIYENTGVSSNLVGAGADRTAYYLSAAYAMGKNTLKAAYAKANDSDSVALGDTSAKQWTLGVEHAMSKRTAVYALYTKMDNAAGGSYGLGGNGAGGATTAATGDDPRAVSLGMKHTF